MIKEYFGIGLCMIAGAIIFPCTKVGLVLLLIGSFYSLVLDLINGGFIVSRKSEGQGDS